jgi:hypothetical protein
MSNKISTYLYIDKGVLETARQVGLNVSRVSENALVEAINRLTGTEPKTSLNSQTPGSTERRGRFEPGALGSTGL